MKKKIVSALLIGAVVVTALTGCKGKSSSSEEQTSSGKKDFADIKVEDYSKYVTPGQYTGLKIEVPSAEVTDAQLKDKIADIIKDGTEKEHLTDRVVADKDSIHLQYTGYLDGTAFEGGSTGESGTDYTIGGNYISDLNDQLIGLECGKDYDLECKFPDDYSTNKDLAGKTVTFKVKVDYIYGDDIVPEWNDEFVKKYSKDEYSTVADYEKYLKEQLKKTNEANQSQQYEKAVWDKVIENCGDITYPDDKLKDTYDEYYSYYSTRYSSMASMYSTTYEDLLKLYGTSDEELQSGCMDQAKSEMSLIMTACVIASKEEIKVEQSEYESLVNDCVTNYSYDSADSFRESYGDDYIMESFIFKNVSTFLYDSNEMVVTDKPIYESESEAE